MQLEVRAILEVLQLQVVSRCNRPKVLTCSTFNNERIISISIFTILPITETEEVWYITKLEPVAVLTKVLYYIKTINQIYSSGMSTLGLLGLFARSHSPSQRTASFPAGFTLHSSTNPFTKVSWIEGCPFTLSLINDSSCSPDGRGGRHLILGLLDAKAHVFPWGTRYIVSNKSARLWGFLENPESPSWIIISETHQHKRN